MYVQITNYLSSVYFFQLSTILYKIFCNNYIIFLLIGETYDTLLNKHLVLIPFQSVKNVKHLIFTKTMFCNLLIYFY